MKWSPKRKCFDLLSNFLNSFFKEIYRDQFGEFVCGYWGLKGYWGCVSLLLANFRPVPHKSPSSLCKRQLGLLSFLFSKWPIERRSRYVTLPCRVVTKISSCRVNTTSRWGIKPLGISFDSIFLLFANKSSRGPLSSVAGENPRPPALNDNPAMVAKFLVKMVRMLLDTLLPTTDCKTVSFIRLKLKSAHGHCRTRRLW